MLQRPLFQPRRLVSWGNLRDLRLDYLELLEDASVFEAFFDHDSPIIHSQYRELGRYINVMNQD